MNKKFKASESNGHRLYHVRDYSVNKIKKIEEFIWKEGAFWGRSIYNNDQTPKYRFPKISAKPMIKAQEYRVSRKRDFWTRKPGLRIQKMAKLLNFRTFVNWNYTNYGNPQIAIKGAKNQAKSNMINWMTAIKLTRGKRVIMYCDLNLEAKHLVAHGKFKDYKDFAFEPFKIDIWIPQGYMFKRVDFPLWDYYPDTVKLREYKTVDDIVDSTEPGKLTVIYSDCYDQKNIVKLTYDLVLILAEKVEKLVSFYIVHHELHKLFKQLQDKGTTKLMDKLADEFADFRKHSIGLIAGYHLGSEVHYRFAQKFILIINKRPPNRKTLTPAEKDAQNYRINEFNMEIAGYYRKHEYSYFPELPRWFSRLIPQREKISYPDFQPIGTIMNKEEKYRITATDLRILHLRNENVPYSKIALELSMNKGTVHSRYEKLMALGAK